MRLLWLPDVLRGAGLDVLELDGWRTRGRELDAAHAVIVHDTVTTTSWSDADVDRLLVHGRSDLPGPLYHVGVDRDAVWRVIASGRANHAGYGVPWGNSTVGVGVYCAGGLSGREEPWSDLQRASVAVGARAILDRLGRGLDRLAGHKEVDTRGKIDPYGIDMDQLRRDAAEEHEMVTEPEDVRYYQGILATSFTAPHDQAGPPYDIGKIDGIVGPRTADAIRDWQRRRGIKVTGTLTIATCNTLQSHANRAHASDEVRRMITAHLETASHGGDVDLSGYSRKGHTHTGDVTVR